MSVRFRCPTCNEDVTAQVRRKQNYRGMWARQVIAVCTNGHYARYTDTTGSKPCKACGGTGVIVP